MEQGRQADRDSEPVPVVIKGELFTGTLSTIINMTKMPFTGLQVLPQASSDLQGNSNDGQNKPAFSFDNDTTMNLDGPGYALSLLLLGHYFLNSVLGSIFGACRSVHKCCPSVGDAISRGL